MSFTPPLITTGKLAPWVLVRDFVLTLMAWMVLIWLMRHLLLVLWSGIAEVTGMSARWPVSPIRPEWDLLVPFLQAAAFVMAVIAGFTWQRRALLNATPLGRPEPVLDAAAHGARFGLAAEQLAALRSSRVTVVHCDAEGNIVALEERSP